MLIFQELYHQLNKDEDYRACMWNAFLKDISCHQSHALKMLVGLTVATIKLLRTHNGHQSH